MWKSFKLSTGRVVKFDLLDRLKNGVIRSQISSWENMFNKLSYQEEVEEYKLRLSLS